MIIKKLVIIMGLSSVHRIVSVRDSLEAITSSFLTTVPPNSDYGAMITGSADFFRAIFLSQYAIMQLCLPKFVKCYYFPKLFQSTI